MATRTASARTNPQTKQATSSVRAPAFTTHKQPPVSQANSFNSFLGNQRMNELLNSRRIQPKLRLSQPSDPDELEADRVANQVVSSDCSNASSRQPLLSKTAGSARTVHRKCSCSSSMSKCATCEEEIEGTKGILRKSSNASAPAEAPESLLHGLGPGRPLDSPVRKLMESHLGQDFAGIRIHDDHAAAQSAESIAARAYTSGNHIYFSAGNYAPQSTDGQRLLAHELVHVVQQNKSNAPSRGSSASPSIARKSESSVTAPTGPPGCTPNQSREIVPAANLGMQWLDKSIAALSRFITAPADKANKTVTDALRLHFASTDPAIAQRVLQRASLVRNDINSARGGTELTTECHAASDTDCHDAGAYVTGDANHLVFCPAFFGAPRNWQAETIVHEMAHSVFPSSKTHITDRAYQGDRAISRLSTTEALTNADSFALFVQELGSGTVQASTAPKDDFANSCKDIESPLRDAIAKAQRWNFNADTDVLHRATKPMMQQAIGIDSAQSRQAAQDFYSKADKGFRDSFKFQCDKDCKARTAWGEDSGHRAVGTAIGAGIGAALGAVGGALFGFGALLGFGLGLLVGGLIGFIAGSIASKGPLIHICPIWKGQANSAAGTEAVLGAAYEAMGNSTADSLKYAKLAAALQVNHPPADTLEEIDRSALQLRLQVVQSRLIKLRKRYQSSSDEFADSVIEERLKGEDKRTTRDLKGAARSDLAAHELWGGTFASSTIRKIVRVSASDTAAALSANLQIAYQALPGQDAQKQAAIDIPRIESAIRSVWTVKIAHGEYAGVNFTFNPSVTLLPHGQQRSENAFLITVRGPDQDPSTGDAVHGEISLASAHLQGARVIVVAHELAHAFGFLDTYATEILNEGAGKKTERMTVGRSDPQGRADLLGMIDPANLDKALKKGSITKEAAARQAGPVHIWEEEASIVLRTLGVPPPAQHRPTPDDDNFDPRVELDRIGREGEARLADVRARRKRADDAVESVTLAEEIIKLESEEKSIQSQLAGSAAKP